MEEGSQQGVEFENTTEVMYKFLEEKLKIERPRKEIELPYLPVYKSTF